MKSWESVVIATLAVLVILLLTLGLLIGGSIFVGVQARRRGYSPWLWGGASVLLINPVIFLVMLALMPNRLRIQQRKRFRKEIAAKLAARTALPPPADAGPLPAASTQTIGRSLGDLPTFAPRDKSLGDEETRGA